MTDILTDQQIEHELSVLPRWSRSADEIRGEFRATDFVGALALVNAVGALAESAGHHPDIDIRYTKITCMLTTHDAGGITQKDLNMANEIEFAATR